MESQIRFEGQPHRSNGDEINVIDLIDRMNSELEFAHHLQTRFHLCILYINLILMLKARNCISSIKSTHIQKETWIKIDYSL